MRRTRTNHAAFVNDPSWQIKYRCNAMDAMRGIEAMKQWKEGQRGLEAKAGRKAEGKLAILSEGRSQGQYLLWGCETVCTTVRLLQ